jgi:hypothetical protein
MKKNKSPSIKRTKSSSRYSGVNTSARKPTSWRRSPSSRLQNRGSYRRNIEASDKTSLVKKEHRIPSPRVKQETPERKIKCETIISQSPPRNKSDSTKIQDEDSRESSQSHRLGSRKTSGSPKKGPRSRGGQMSRISLSTTHGDRSRSSSGSFKTGKHAANSLYRNPSSSPAIFSRNPSPPSSDKRGSPGRPAGND